MKRWTWIMALMLALMIPLQGCTSNTPKDGGEEQNQQEQQEEELEQEEEKEPEEDKEPEDTQAPTDEPENSDGDTPVSNQGQNNTSSENTSASVQKPQGGGSSSSQGSSTSQGSSQPSQGGGTQPQQPQQPEEKPQPAALSASQVVSSLLSQHSMGDLADYNGMVGTLYGGIDLSQMESYSVKGPAMGTTATEIAVFQVKDGGSTASVEKALRQRADDIARTFEQYDPEQYEIAKKAVVRTEGNYVCMVIGSNASAVASSFEKLV